MGIGLIDLSGLRLLGVVSSGLSALSGLGVEMFLQNVLKMAYYLYQLEGEVLGRFFLFCYRGSFRVLSLFLCWGGPSRVKLL